MMEGGEHSQLKLGLVRINLAYSQMETTCTDSNYFIIPYRAPYTYPPSYIYFGFYFFLSNWSAQKEIHFYFIEMKKTNITLLFCLS
jgi:hypothetical protein